VYNSENKRTRISKSPLCAVRLHKKPWGRESCYTGKLTALIPTPPTLYMLKLSLRLWPVSVSFPRSYANGRHLLHTKNIKNVNGYAHRTRPWMIRCTQSFEVHISIQQKC